MYFGSAVVLTTFANGHSAVMDLNALHYSILAPENVCKYIAGGEKAVIGPSKTTCKKIRKIGIAATFCP